MKLHAVFREIDIQDIGPNCPFMPEPDEFEIHLQAMAEDIAMIDGVVDVSRQGERELVITITDTDLEDFKPRLKPTLQNHFQHLRISVLETTRE